MRQTLLVFVGCLGIKIELGDDPVPALLQNVWAPLFLAVRMTMSARSSLGNRFQRSRHSETPSRQSAGSAAKLGKRSLAPALPAPIHPGDDRGPDCGVRAPSDQRSQVLQAYADFARIFDNARISRRQGIDERLHRLKRGDIVRGVDDRKHGRRYALRAYQLIDPQLASTKSILTIEPLNELCRLALNCENAGVSVGIGT